MIVHVGGGSMHSTPHPDRSTQFMHKIPLLFFLGTWWAPTPGLEVHFIGPLVQNSVLI